MNSEVYLSSVLTILSGSFDITRPAVLGGMTYPAYASFLSLSEKYVVSPKVNLWSARVHEHILFIKTPVCTMQTLQEALFLIEHPMEETFVRKGEKLPEKDHMLSCLTVCILSEETADEEVKKALEKIRYEKSYLFTFRGRAEGRIILADLSSETVCGNRFARQVLTVYQKGFCAKMREREEEL